MFDFLNKNKVGGNKSKSPRKKVGPLFTGSPVQTITLKNKGIPKSKFSSNKIRKNISDKDLYKVSRPSNGGIPARFHHIQENVATPQGASSPRASQIGINTTLKSAKYFGIYIIFGIYKVQRRPHPQIMSSVKQPKRIKT